MRTGIDEYIQQVLSNLVVEEAMKRRIEKDLRSHIAERSESADAAWVIDRMGPPEEVAREFMDSIYDDNSQIIDSLVNERQKTRELARASGYEYKSSATLMGLPLVHINIRRRGGIRVAKGIIAIGDVAVGVLSIGGITLGGLSFGGISLGILSLGGVSLGVLVALGGLAVGTAAIGGLAVGKVAIGGLAVGKVAIGARAIGKFILETEQDVVTRESVYELINNAYPNMKDWVIQIFSGRTNR